MLLLRYQYFQNLNETAKADPAVSMGQFTLSPVPPSSETTLSRCTNCLGPSNNLSTAEDSNSAVARQIGNLGFVGIWRQLNIGVDLSAFLDFGQNNEDGSLSVRVNSSSVPPLVSIVRRL